LIQPPHLKSRLFAETAEIVMSAVADLEARRFPAPELRAVLRDCIFALRCNWRITADQFEPYLIPNDLSQCTCASVLNCSHADVSVDLPAGFSIEAAATKPTAFAKPYYIDPVHALRRCKGLAALERYSDRFVWDYDMAFVGHQGKGPMDVISGRTIVDAVHTRRRFLNGLTNDPIIESGFRLHLQLNDKFFFSDSSVTAADREDLNRRSLYVESMMNSRFVLCPRGNGPNSIRFFEALATSNVPIYIGESETRFPLDWLINWNQACYRISSEEVLTGSWASRLRQILATPVDEINRRRRYIFRIYHQFLAPERRRVFEQLVLLRVAKVLWHSESLK
jgi:Exostosin family